MTDRAALEQMLNDVVDRKVGVERSPVGFLVLAEALAGVRKPPRPRRARWVFDEG